MPISNRSVIPAFLLTILATLAGTLAAQPTLDWEAHYEHIVPSAAEPGSGDPILGKKCLVADAAGNTYVTGRSRNNSASDDYATVKYDAGGNEVWVARYNGPANLHDYAYAIALDGNGDVVVTGRSESAASSWDYATVKYNGTTGAQIWAMRYGAPGVTDHAYALAIDASNDVYVTGFATIGGQRDFATVKYDGATGATAWTGGSFVNGAAIWDSTTGNDQAIAIAVNATGIYVTGRSFNGTDNDYATVAYDAAGAVQWSGGGFNNGAAIWASTTGSTDEPNAIALDGSGSIYVTGFSVIGPSNDFATVKYNAVGAIQWGSVPGNDNGAVVWNHTAIGDDIATDITVDGAGDVIVTGHCSNGSNDDFATIKYSAAGLAQWSGAGFNNGAVIWNNTTSNNNERAYALATDSSNNIFVTGFSSNGPNVDYATTKYTSAGAPAWSGGSFINGAVVMAGTGNSNDSAYGVVTRGTDAFVTGNSNNGNYDYATIKYDNAGAEVWNTRFVGGTANSMFGNNDTIRAKNCLKVDAAGNVYVTGSSLNGSYWDYSTVKYDGGGNQLWVATWNSGANSHDFATGLALDSSGDVFVTGRSLNAGGSGGYNYATIKYNGATGAAMWSGGGFDNGAAVWNSSANSTDQAFALAVDSSGNVFVTGYSDNAGGSGSLNYATIKYNGATGAAMWSTGTDNGAAVWNSSGNSNDYARALAVDSSNNVFVTGYGIDAGGSGGYNYATIKYNGATGAAMWSGAGFDNGAAVWTSSGSNDDIAYALAVDSSGNVFVTGYGFNAGGSGSHNYATIKYNGATGAAMWSTGTDNGAAYWTSAGTNNDYAYALAVDSSDDVIVTGCSGGSGNNNYATIKYDGTNGAAVWSGAGFDNGAAVWSGSGSNNDQAWALAVDAAGSVYVTGHSYNGSNNEFATVKYSTNGVELWVQTEDSGGDDRAFAVALAPGNKVVVAGTGVGSIPNAQGFWTLQYSDAPLPPPTQVWVDPLWSGTTLGTDPDGVGPATSFGYDSFADIASAIAGVANGGTLSLSAGTYAGFQVDKTLNLVGAGIGSTIIRGASPALTVNAPGTTASGMTFEVDTAPTPNDPTILILSGDLTIDTSLVIESGSFDQAAFRLTGGALVFGASVTINRQGAGQLFDHQTTGAIDATGTTLQDNGVAFADNFAIEDAISHRLDNATVGLVSWVANNVYVTTSTLGIQAGVDAATAGDTVNVDAGTYDEQVVVGKALSIEGPNMGVSGTAVRAAEGILTVTGGTNTNPLLEVTVAGVTVDGLRFESDAAQSAGGIFARTAGSGTGLIVRNNVILAMAGTSADGILVDDTGAAPTIARNLIDSGAGDFDTALRLVGAGGTVGGVALDAGNQLEGLSADFVSADAGTTLSIRRNTFNRSGAVVDDPAAVVTVRENFFTPAAASPQALLLRHVNQAAVDVLANAFSGHENIAVLSGASSGVTLDGNSFTPGGAATNFTHVLVTGSFPTTSAPPTGTTNSITLTNNSFTAATATGRALDFQNHDDTAVWGPVVIGTPGNFNSFELAHAQYLRLQLTPFLAPTFAGHVSLTPGNFTFNLNAANNLFHVNPGPGVVPTSMSAGERATLESKTFHKVDNTGVGLVDYGFNYLPTLTSVSNLGPTDEGVELNIPYATLLGASDAADVDGTIAALVVTPGGVGVLEITPLAGIRGAVSVPQVVAAGDVLHWAPPGDLNNLNNSGPVAVFTMIARDNLGDDSSPSVGVSVDVNAVNDAPVATGSAPITLDEDTTDTVTFSFTDVDVGETGSTGIVRFQLGATSGNLTLSTLVGLTPVGAGGNGTPSLEYTGSPTDVNNALVNVQYAPLLNFFGSDTIVFTIYDEGNVGSGGSQSDVVNVGVTVDPINDDPVLSSVPANLPYDENDPATVIAPAASLIDVDSPDFDSGILIVSYFVGGGAEDQLAVLNSGAITTAPGAPGFVDLLDGATIFASFPDAGPGSGINGAALNFSFNVDSTPSRVEALIRRITYENLSDTPAATRSVQFTVTDGDTGVDNASITLITVTAINDAPTISAGTISGAFEDTAFDITFADLVTATGASDLDGNVVGFTVTSQVSGLALQIDETGTGLSFVLYVAQVIDGVDILRWQTNLDDNGLIGAFNVEAIDDGTPGVEVSLAPELVSIDVAPVNDAPSFTPTTATPTVDEDSGPATFTAWAPGVIGPNFDAGGGADENTQAPLSYSIQSVTNGALFTTAPAINLVGSDWDLTFEPALNQNGTSNITVRVTDDGPTGGSNVEFQDIVFTITVNAVNDEPTFVQGAGFATGPFATIGPKVVANWAAGMSPGGGVDEVGQLLSFVVSPPTVVVAPMNFAALPVINAVTGELTFNIDIGSTGIATFSVTLEDDGAQTPPNDHISQAMTLIIAMRQGQVYVDLDDAALNYGDTPTLGNFFGIDAFAGVQAGLDNVADAGAVDVDGNAVPYGNALISRSVTLNLAPTAVLLGDGVPALGANAGIAQVNGGTLRQTSTFNDPCVYLVGGTMDLDATVIEQNTDEDALRIDGASVTLDGVEIRESNSNTRRVIDLLSGSLDANTGAANTFRIRGSGSFVNNATPGGVDALSNVWDNNGTSLNPTLRADGLAIEDLVNHAIDNAAFGLVRWDVDSLYVTQGSGSIQRGVDNSNPGDTLEVGVGVFAEYVVVDKSLLIYGEQRDNDADIRFGAFNPLIESIVVPFDTLGGNDLFRVRANSVAINGFVLDGVTGGTNARSGVTNDDGLGGVVEINSLMFQHNIVRNMTDAGVSLANNGTALTNVVSFNVFTGLDGSAVRASDDSFINIIDNTLGVPGGAIGIEMRSFSIDRNGITTIQDNRIDIGAGAIAIELVSLDLTSASPIIVSTNTILSVGGAGSSSGTTGLRVAFVWNDMDVLFTGNTLGGATLADEFEFGFSLFEIETPDLLISGGSIDSALTGVLIDSATPAAAAGANAVVEINGVDIGQTIPGTDGVVARAVDQGVIPVQLVQLDLVGCNVTGLLSGVTVETDASGANARVSVDGGTVTGSGIGGHAVEIIGATAGSDIADAVLTGDADAVRVTDGAVSVTDSDLAAGVTGLHVRAGGRVLLFDNNALTGAGNGILILGGAAAVSSIFDNSITVTGNGLENQSVLAIDAERNWWGDTTGPTHSGNLGGVGVAVVNGGFGAVGYSPWWADSGNLGGTPGFAGGAPGPSLFGDNLHAVPTELEWSVQPPNGSAGLALTPGPRVRARDANDVLGYNWDAANSDAFLVFSNNPTGASLQGNPVIQASNGFAEFTNVAVSTGGVGFTVFVIGDYGTASLANSPVSLPFNIDNLSPSLSGITPNFVHEGAGSVTIQVDGTNFNSTTVVRFDGADRPTFFINPSRVLAALAAQDTATISIGTHLIDVRNPSPGGGITGSLPFVVNDIPNSIGLANTLVAENLAGGAVVDTFTTADPGDTHTYALVFGGGSQDNASFSLASGGLLTTAATFDFETKSSYSIRVRSTDSFGAWIEQVFTINVTNVNEAPTGVADSYSTNEDVTLNVNAGAGVLANDTDVDALTSLTAAQIGGTPAGAQSLTLNPDGSFDLVPLPNFNGVISFQYTVTDNGAPMLNDGPINVTVTVNPVNDAPTFTLAAATASDEDAGAQSFAAASAFDAGAINETDTVLAYEIVANSNAALFSTQPSINTVGQLTYTAAANANGSAVLDVRVRDNGGTASGGVDVSGVQQITVTVNPINDAPSFTVSAANSIITRNEDSGLTTITNWASFSAGPPNESGQGVLSYNINPLGVSNPALFVGGAPSVAANGTLTFTPAPQANGSSTFDVSVTDDSPDPGINTSATQTFTIIINPVNDAPTLTGVSTLLGGTEDTPFVVAFGDLLTAGNQTDPDSDPLSFRIDSLLAGGLTMNGNPVVPGTTIFSTGNLTWTPPSNANGVAVPAFTVLAWDGLLPSASPVTVSIELAPVNDVPVLVSNAGATVLEGASVVIAQSLLEATDVEDAASGLTYELVAVATNGTLFLGATPLISGSTFTQDDINLGLLSYVHDDTETSSDVFTFFVVDTGVPVGRLPAIGNVTFGFTITPDNDAPSLTSVNTLPGGIEDTALAITWSDLNTNAVGLTDPEGDPLSFRVEGLSSGTLTKNGNPVVVGVTTVANGESLIWTPALNENGTLGAFTVVAFDGSLGSGTPRQVSVSVAPVNDQPSISVPTPAVTSEDTGANIIPGWATMLPGGGLDESGQTPVSWNVVSVGNPGLFTALGQPVVTLPNGDLEFTLTANAFGVSTIDVEVTDDGTPNATSVVQTFTITVNNVNDAPTLSFISVIFGGAEDSTITVPFAILQGAANESDIDSSPVNFLVEPVSVNGTATMNSVPFTAPTVFTAADILEWTPTADFNGTLIAFNVRAWDGLAQSTNVLPLRIFVEPVNDEPNFAASSPSASLEDAGAITVLGWSLFDAGPPNEDTTQAVLNYTVSGVVTTSGTLAFLSGPTIDNNGNLHYQAAPDTNGTATFMAQVRDTGGTATLGDDTSPLNGPFTITVTPVNDAPTFVAAGNPAAVDEDSGAATVPGWITSVDFGPSDEDLSQGVLDWLIDQVSDPLMFSAQPDVVAGELTYTPAGDAFGTVTFRVRLQDNGGGTAPDVDTSAGQTFTITINPVNDAPSVTGGTSPLVAEDAGLQTLVNFVGMNPGPANESAQVALAYTVQNLTLLGGLTFTAPPVIDAAGTLTFQTSPDSNGSATFQVRVQDNGGSGGANVDTSALSAVFTITVTPVNDAPTLTSVSILTGAFEDTGFSISYATLFGASNAADIDSAPVNFRVAGVTTGTLTKNGIPVVPGSTTLAATESLVWTPTGNQNGILNAFTVTGWDGSAASSPPVQVQVNVTPINDEPSFTKGSNITVAWDQGPQSIPGWASAISAGPTDESSQTLTFNITGNTNTALFSAQPSVTAAGTLTFTPALNVAGTASISLELMDNGGVVNTGDDDTSPPQSFTITISTAGEIDVSRNSNPVPDGNIDSLGTNVPVLTPLNLTYLIENTGNGLLQLTNTTTPVVVLSTINADAWVTHQPDSTLVTTTSSNFVVHVVPLTTGSFSVDIFIDNTDANENPYDVTISGTAIDAPDIGLARGFRADIPSGASDDLGVVPTGIATAFTYVVRNQGTTDLTFGSPQVAASSATNCAVAFTPPAGPVAASGTDNLVLDVTPTVAGVFSFVLTINSNDPDEDPFTLFVQGKASGGAQPELELFGRRVLAPMDTENVGLIPSGSNTTFLYEVRNIGASSLSVSNPVLISNPLNCVAVVTVTPGSTVAPGNLTVLGIDVQPIAPGPFQFGFELITNDADESPLPVTVTGQSTASVIPEIAVDRDGVPIPSGATDDIGDLALGLYSTFIYRVRNEGTSTLNVNRPVTVSGQSNCELFIVAFPDVNIAPQDDSVLIVGIRPLGTGALSAMLRISNNDSNEGNYLIDIIGTGPEADIRVESPEFTPLASGGTFALAGAKAGSTSVMNLWVRNVGTGDLTIAGVSASSEVNCSATVVSAGASPVTAGSSTMLTLDVLPVAAGPFNFTVTITSNDPDTGNYVIFVTGNAAKSGKGGGKDDGGCSTGEGGANWLLLLAALSALVAATRAVRTRKP